jgi:hypothetical protein
MMKVTAYACLRWIVVSGVLAGPTFVWSKNVEVADDSSSSSRSEKTCAWEDREACEGGVYRDPNLKPMVIQLDGLEETFDAYVMPDVATFYNATPGSIKKQNTSFKGMFGKFINLSNKPVRVYWKPANKKQQPSYIADLAPFGGAGTATYPGHMFILTEPNDVSKVLADWTMTRVNSNYKYDPYGSVAEAEKVLSADELELYKLQHRNLAFDRIYHRFTGRQWVALYGRKYAPRYPMWPADSFGQTHVITTKETHIISQPPEDFAQKKVSTYGATPEQLEQLKAYRSPEETLTLNMTVISVAPRAFEIRNFLSSEEVTHILELSTGMQLSRSTTRAGSIGEMRTDDATRTSQNSWVGRERSPIVDAIFRRAADLLQIDEACFRFRNKDEQHLVPDSKGPITERLQLVHYGVGKFFQYASL